MIIQVREKEDRFQQRSLDAFVTRGGPRDAPADRPTPDADMEVQSLGMVA